MVSLNSIHNLSIFLSASYSNFTYCTLKRLNKIPDEHTAVPRNTICRWKPDCIRVFKTKNNFLFPATAGKPVCHIFQRALCQLSPSAPSAGADSAAGSRPGASFPPSAGGQSSASSSQHRWGWWIQIIHWQPICRQRRRYRWDHKHKQSVRL